MKERLFLGVDLGGTQLRMAAVGADGALASSLLSVPTGRNFTPPDLARKMAELIEQMRSLVEGAEIEAVGVGTAGEPLVTGRGHVVAPAGESVARVAVDVFIELDLHGLVTRGRMRSVASLAP